MNVYSLMLESTSASAHPVPFAEVKLPCRPLPGEALIIDKERVYQLVAARFDIIKGEGRCGLLVRHVANMAPDGALTHPVLVDLAQKVLVPRR